MERFSRIANGKMFSADIPRDVSKLLSDLHVIANIPEGHKFNVRDNTYSSIWSTYDIATRRINGETGKRTIEHINHLLGLAIDLSRKYPDYVETIQTTVESLQNAMMNLQQCYQNQPTIHSDLCVIILRLNRKAFQNAVRGSSPIPIRRPSSDSVQISPDSRSRSLETPSRAPATPLQQPETPVQQPEEEFNLDE
jgi:hypothetical protein